MPPLDWSINLHASDTLSSQWPDPPRPRSRGWAKRKAPRGIVAFLFSPDRAFDR